MFCRRLQLHHSTPLLNQPLPNRILNLTFLFQWHWFSSRRDPIRVNLDEGFDRQDLDNLRDIGLQLPSRIYESDTIPQTRERIKTLNKSLGQYLGIGAASKKISKESKARMESQRDTLKKYKDRLEQTESANKLLPSSKRWKIRERRTGSKQSNTWNIILFERERSMQQVSVTLCIETSGQYWPE